MRIAVVHGNDGSDVRLGKTCRSLCRIGHEVVFLGWDRRPDIAKTIDLGQTCLKILTCPTTNGRWSFSGQIRYWWHIISNLKSFHPDAVCCVNEDLTFLILPFHKIFYKYLICDVYDALSDRHSHRSRILRFFLGIISKIVRIRADRLIATDNARFNRFGNYKHKCVVIENVPEDPGEDLSKLIPTGKTKIYVTGSLSSGRGLENIIEAIEGLDVEIISTGWPYYDYAKDTFIKHPKVSFHGIVTSQESLHWATQCDAILALYAPSSVNNLYASPNKIYDAMSVGRPVIINSEAIISHWVQEKNIGFVCEYNDIKALKLIVISLAERRTNLLSFAHQVRQIYQEQYTWQLMENRLKKLYDEIAE